jgi:putative ABC transport system permease protein
LRTAGIIVILAVCVGLALIMLTVHGATQNQLGSIGEEIGTDITIRPAGLFGMMGGGEPLQEEDIDQLYDIPHVIAVQETIQTQYTGDALEPAIEPGTLGGSGQVPDGASAGAPDLEMPIITMGFDPSIEDPVLMGDAHIDMIDGRYFTIEERDANVAVIGDNLADKNELVVGSQFEIEEEMVEVIGIFESGQLFGDNILVMPIDTVQRLFNVEGVTSITVIADDVDNVEGVVNAVREIFDEETADIITTQETYGRINKSVVNAGNTSQIAMIAAFIVAAVIILVSVVLMMRQRVKEIGILKAIGASNWRIGFQFTIETMAMSLVAAIIGALITFPLAQVVGDMLINDTGTAKPGLGGFTDEGIIGGGGFAGGGPFGGGVTSVAGIDVAVSPEVFLYALAIAVALAIAASLLPSWYISRVKPAEVLRHE